MMIFIYSLAFLLTLAPAYVNKLKCSTPLTTSSTIMGSKCALSSGRTVKVMRGSTLITSGSSYIPGESLTILLSSIIGEYVFETNIGTFTGGSCNRYTSKNGVTATLVLPKSGSGTVSIKAAYSTNYGTVYLTSTITLVEGIISSNTPSSKPTLIPTTISPTIKPTIKPTYLLGAPTPYPSTSTPSSYPTSSSPSFTSTYSPSIHTTQFLALPDSKYNVVIVFVNDDDILFNTEVTNVFQNALRNVLQSFISEPAAVEISSTSSSKQEEEEEELQVQRRRRRRRRRSSNSNKQTAITLFGANVFNIKIQFIVAYLLQSTIYTSTSDLKSALDIALHNAIDTSTQLLDAIKSSSITELQNLSSSSYLSINSIATDDDASNNDDAYHESIQKKLTIGLIVGGVACCIIALLMYSFFSYSDEAVTYVFAKIINPSYIWIAFASASAAIGLVAAWTRDDSGDQTGYLGKPSWDSNVFAWHPILMVCYFFCQLQAIFNWTLFTNHNIAKLSHVFTQFIALVVMIIGLIAVVKDNYTKKIPSLNTMHAWIGVCSIALFGFNFLWGACMALLTIFHPDSKLRRLIALLQIHRIIGSSALALTAGAILTGIMDYLPYGSCFYILSSTTSISMKDTDPAENYSYLPNACKIANGLGIVIVVSCMFGIISIISRATMLLVHHQQQQQTSAVAHTYLRNDMIDENQQHHQQQQQQPQPHMTVHPSNHHYGATTTTATNSVTGGYYKSLPTATAVIPIKNINTSSAPGIIMEEEESYQQHP